MNTAHSVMQAHLALRSAIIRTERIRNMQRTFLDADLQEETAKPAIPILYNADTADYHDQTNNDHQF
jgi:hypothetical protein